MSRMRKFSVILAGLIVVGGFVVYQVSQQYDAIVEANRRNQAVKAFQDADAKAKGFVDAADRGKAQARGFTEAKAWTVERDRLKKEAGAAAERERQRAAQAKADEDRKRYDDRLTFSACYDAERAVTNILKAPSSAKFLPCTDVRISKDRKLVFVQGEVDAQNSFGAMLRNTYMVAFTHRDGGDPMTALSSPIATLGKR